MNTKGYTLIEVMLCLVLSSEMILAGMLLLQRSHHFSLQAEQQVEQLQQHYYALHNLRYMLKMAGYFVCQKPNAATFFNHASLVTNNGLLLTTADNSKTNFLNDLAPHSPVIISEFSDPHWQLTTLPMKTTQAPITLAHNLANRGQNIIISNCLQSDLFSTLQTKKIIPRQTLSIAYQKHSFVSAVQTEYLYLRKNQHSPGYGLYLRINNQRGEELLAGIKSMAVNLVDKKWVQLQLAFIKGKPLKFTVRLRNL
jgi:Tfp pilus assembly protein PilW